LTSTRCLFNLPPEISVKSVSPLRVQRYLSVVKDPADVLVLDLEMAAYANGF